MITMRYETRLGTKPFKVLTDHTFDEAFQVLGDIWDWKERRKGWQRIFPSLRSIAFGLQEDSGIQIVLDELPKLKSIDGEIRFKPNRYGFSGYGFTKHSPVIEFFGVYDLFYLNRKPWKKKSQWHADHLLAQGGYRLG